MIYLAVLKNSIDIFVNESIGKTNEVGYTINVDALLFDRVFKGSYETMKELVIESRFATNELDFKKNVRVITEREEQLLPVFEQKSGKKLPLKSFYMYARLNERYIHLSLNQVVIEGQTPDTNSKSIIIKSKIIPLEYLSDLICGNLWNEVQSHRDFILLESSCKSHTEGYTVLQQELSLDELDKLENKLSYFTKKVSISF
jgi:hypothetical protein